MKKTFLSIGTGPGIGMATAARFAREGYRVVLSARNVERLRANAKYLAATGAEIDVQAVDANDAESVADLVTGLGSNLHVLHYNAGVLHYDQGRQLLTRSIEDETTASLVSDTQINITSAMVAIRAAVPTLAGRGSGTVLLTGGGLGVQPSGDFLTLSVGKAAIRALGLALFEPLRAQGVHVATVTVSRLVSADSEHADHIADVFWDLHAQSRGAWTFEEVYR